MLLRAATYATWLVRAKGVSKEAAMEISIALARTGKLTAEGKLRGRRRRLPE